jgi:hypothetical protein
VGVDVGELKGVGVAVGGVPVVVGAIFGASVGILVGSFAGGVGSESNGGG